MDVENETVHQGDNEPLLEGEVQPELDNLEDCSTTVGMQHPPIQLQMAAASFLVTLKEKYKVNYKNVRG